MSPKKPGHRYNTKTPFISPNAPNPLTSMTSQDMEEWLKWLREVTHVTDEWCNWLVQKCDAGKVMANQHKGLFVRPDGTKVNLSAVEWENYKKEIDQESMHLRKTGILIVKRAEAWEGKAKPKEQLMK